MFIISLLFAAVATIAQAAPLPTAIPAFPPELYFDASADGGTLLIYVFEGSWRFVGRYHTGDRLDPPLADWRVASWEPRRLTIHNQKTGQTFVYGKPPPVTQPAATQPTTRPAPFTPAFPPPLPPGKRPVIGEPRFAPLLLESHPAEHFDQFNPDFDGPEVNNTVAWVVDRDYHVLGCFRRGEHLPKPFEQWRLISFQPIIPRERYYGGIASFANDRTGETIEINDLLVGVPNRWQWPTVRVVSPPETHPTTRP